MAGAPAPFAAGSLAQALMQAAQGLNQPMVVIHADAQAPHQAVVNVMEQHFNGLVDYQFTASMEEDLDAIALEESLDHRVGDREEIAEEVHLAPGHPDGELAAADHPHPETIAFGLGFGDPGVLGGGNIVRGSQISMVYQEPMATLNPSLTVGRQLEEVPICHEGAAPAGGWPCPGRQP